MNNNIKISQFNSADELKTGSKFVIYQDGVDLLIDQSLVGDKIGESFVPNTRTVNGYQLDTDITLDAGDVDAYTKEETDLLLYPKLSYYGNWNAAIPTYLMNVVYKYNGQLYTPVEENSSSIDPFSDTTNWKPMTSVIAKTVTTQTGLDEFSLEPHYFQINRSGSSDISLPLSVSGEILIVRNYYARTTGAGGNKYIQEFVDENGLEYRRISTWSTPDYIWGDWVCENQLQIITSYSQLVGFHKNILNNKFISSTNAIAQINTNSDVDLGNLFGSNQNLIVVAKTIGSYPGPSAGDMIYEVLLPQGIRKFATYTASPESLSSFEECTLITTQGELDAFKYSNAFAKVYVDGIPSLKPYFGDDYNKIIIRTFTIAGSGTSAGDWAQEATNLSGIEYIRYFNTVGASWTEWGVKHPQTDVSVGGYANNLYFSEVHSDVNGYESLSYTPEITGFTDSITIKNSDGEKLYKNYLYPTAVSVSSIPAGVWSFTFYGKVSNNVGITQLGVTYFARTTGGTETDLFTVWSNEINNTSDEFFKFEITNPVFNVNVTDRMGARIKAKTTHTQNITLTYSVGDGYGAWLNNPNKIRHNQLRALNEDMAYQHINTQQSKTVPLQTDSFAIYDSVTSTVKLVQKKYTDEIHIGTSAPTENQKVWINTNINYNLTFNTSTGSTINADFSNQTYKVESNYGAGNTVALSGYTNMPKYDSEKSILIKNTNGSDRIFVPTIVSQVSNSITYSFIMMNTSTITVPTNKFLELSYKFSFTSSTTCVVTILYVIQG